MHFEVKDIWGWGYGVGLCCWWPAAGPCITPWGLGGSCSVPLLREPLVSLLLGLFLLPPSCSLLPLPAQASFGPVLTTSSSWELLQSFTHLATWLSSLLPPKLLSVIRITWIPDKLFCEISLTVPSQITWFTCCPVPMKSNGPGFKREIRKLNKLFLLTGSLSQILFSRTIDVLIRIWCAWPKVSSAGQ